MNSIVKTIVGNEAPDQGVPEINVGLCGLVKEKASVMRVTKMQGVTQDEVEEVVVLVETEAEKVGVKMLEVFE